MYAHARIELRAEDGSLSFIERGDEVPDDLEIAGREELVEAGTLSDAEYDPAADVSPPPAQVVVDGVVYSKEDDDA
jgi:hypothetical protein